MNQNNSKIILEEIKNKRPNSRSVMKGSKFVEKLRLDDTSQKVRIVERNIHNFFSLTKILSIKNS